MPDEFDEFDLSKFYLPFPLYYLAERRNDSDGAIPLGPCRTGFIAAEADGTAFIPIFTDADLARRFVDRNALEDAARFRIRDPRHFLKLIGRLPREITHIGFDPSGVGSLARFLIPIARVQQALEREGE